MVAIQEWFVVERIDLGGASVHEEEENAFCAGREVGQFGGEGGGAALLGKEAGEREAPKAGGRALEEASSREREFGVGAVSLKEGGVHGSDRMEKGLVEEEELIGGKDGTTDSLPCAKGGLLRSLRFLAFPTNLMGG